MQIWSCESEKFDASREVEVSYRGVAYCTGMLAYAIRQLIFDDVKDGKMG
jgi:hypothetical protein